VTKYEGMFKMATVAAPQPQTIEPDQVILPEVSWETYCRLRDAEGNDSIRMIYLDGSLTLMAPAFEHEGPNQLLGQLVRAVMTVMGLEMRGIGSVTLRRQIQPDKGVGKEPDVAFYLGEDELRIRGRRKLDLDIDPPPTLAIEVDHTRNSTPALTVYARLGVREVWRFSVPKQSVWIGCLDGQTYRGVDRSVVLPRLTPTLILEALDRFEVGDLGELGWFEWVKAWTQALPEPEAAP